MEYSHIFALVGGILTGIILLLFKLIVSRQNEITEAQKKFAEEMRVSNQAILDKLDTKVSVSYCGERRENCERQTQIVIQGLVKDQANLAEIIKELYAKILHHGHEGLVSGRVLSG